MTMSEGASLRDHAFQSFVYTFISGTAGSYGNSLVTKALPHATTVPLQFHILHACHGAQGFSILFQTKGQEGHASSFSSSVATPVISYLFLFI